MYSVEFDARAENGFIKIPEEYGTLNTRNLKVILIVQESVKEDDYIDKFFDNYSVDLSSFRFNRDEANER